MRPTNFILVEGIIGSGKTTTGWFVKDRLERHGVAARFLPEGPTREEPHHPLRVATELPQPQAVWRDVTVDAFIERSLRKWRCFGPPAGCGLRATRPSRSATNAVTNAATPSSETACSRLVAHLTRPLARACNRRW